MLPARSPRCKRDRGTRCTRTHRPRVPTVLCTPQNRSTKILVSGLLSREAMSRSLVQQAPGGAAAGSSFADEFQGFEQGAEAPAMRPPAADELVRDWLAHLHRTGGPDRPFGLVKAQAGLVPAQPHVVEHPAGLALQVDDEVFVAHVQDHALRQDAAPVLHQLGVAPPITAELAEIVCVVLL